MCCYTRFVSISFILQHNKIIEGTGSEDALSLLTYKVPKGRPKTLNIHEYMILASDKNEMFSNNTVESH